MHHNISIYKQGFFSVLFVIFAIAGPLVSANSSRTDFIKFESYEKKEIPHTKFFCGEWAGNCKELELKNKINFLLNNKN